MLKSHLPTVLALCGSLSGGCSAPQRAAEQSLPDGHLGQNSKAARASLQAIAAPRAGYTTENFTISLRLSGPTTLFVTGSELNPRNGEYEEWDMSEVFVGYAVEQVAMRHSNEWYLFCRLPDGSARVERWDLQLTDGAYYCGRPAATVGIGAAFVTPPMRRGIFQNSYKSPPDRVRPAVARTPLLTGISMDAVHHMAVDPDGRFLILEVLHPNASRELLQLALIPSPTTPAGSLTQLWDFSAIPELPELMSLALRDHPVYGRSLLFGHAVGRAVLFDHNNDGDFDDSELFTDDAAWFGKYPAQGWSRAY